MKITDTHGPAADHFDYLDLADAEPQPAAGPAPALDVLSEERDALARTAVATTRHLTITATAHPDCHACQMSAEGARYYVENGGHITNGKAGNGQLEGGPHWATFTTEEAQALAEASSQS